MTTIPEQTLSTVRQAPFWALIRSSPISLIGVLILINIMYPSLSNFIFMILYLFTFGSNIVFKYIAQIIYKFLGTDYIPFIGQGTRPSGAYGCSSFISYPLIKATTFGMPSGHSQLAWFFITFACLNIIYKNTLSDTHNNEIYLVNWTKNKKVLSCIVLISIASIISYSRVYIDECHTTGQVIIGGCIGITMAIIGWNIVNWLGF